MTKVIQKQAAFYKLYEEYQKDPKRFVATWEFVGEILIKPLNKWVLMSYKCPARLSDIMNENPTLMVRRTVKGKSGSNYYAYKFKDGVSIADIQDPEMQKFYKKIKANHADR